MAEPFETQVQVIDAKHRIRNEALDGPPRLFLGRRVGSWQWLLVTNGWWLMMVIGG